MTIKQPPTIEQRLYEAYRAGHGVRLSFRDVTTLLGDDAIGTRVTNEACRQAGIEEPGHDRVPVSDLPTWRQFSENQRWKP